MPLWGTDRFDLPEKLLLVGLLDWLAVEVVDASSQRVAVEIAERKQTQEVEYREKRETHAREARSTIATRTDNSERRTKNRNNSEVGEGRKPDGQKSPLAPPVAFTNLHHAIPNSDRFSRPHLLSSLL